jgi:parallel beta-helix repeat protein
MARNRGQSVHCPEENTVELKQIFRVLVTSALIAGFAVQITAARPAVAAPPMLVPISTCVTIAVSGNYALTKNLGPVTSSCITISASNVVLNLKGFTITGTGPAAVHGVGIASAAANARVGNGRITGFRFGVDDLGSHARLAKLVIYANRQAGAYLQGSTDSVVTNSSFRGNQHFGILMVKTVGAVATGDTILTSAAYGIWVKSSTNFQLLSNHVQDNGLIGIYVGCSGKGISHALTCPKSTAGLIENNNPVSHNAHAGIAVDTGNIEIHVMSNTALSNPTDDLIDTNPGCTGNTWSGDTYTTHNQVCVK